VTDSPPYTAPWECPGCGRKATINVVALGVTGVVHCVCGRVSPVHRPRPEHTAEQDEVCLRCEKSIHRDRRGTWRTVVGDAECHRNPARDGHEPRDLPTGQTVIHYPTGPDGEWWTEGGAHLGTREACDRCATAKKDAVLRALREHWPESGGQSAHAQALAAQDACADAILRVIPSGQTEEAERPTPCPACGWRQYPEAMLRSRLTEEADRG
jgi:hypothetical protein